MRQSFLGSNWIWIAVGSALGGVARYALTGAVPRYLGATFPWGTLAVNILGSALIGFFATLTGPDGKWLLTPRVRQFVMIGIFGGFTTFSSFSLETLNLAREGETARAVWNVGASVVCCLVAVWLGHVLAARLNWR
jgi:CrcB protein